MKVQEQTNGIHNALFKDIQIGQVFKTKGREDSLVYVKVSTSNAIYYDPIDDDWTGICIHESTTVQPKESTLIVEGAALWL